MQYIEYLNKGQELINFIFLQQKELYNPLFYNSEEWRKNSEEAEKDIINTLFLNNEEYQYLENIDEKEYTNWKFWYNYYQHKQYWYIIVIPVSYRHRFDIAIINNNEFYPINIKITNGTTSDNLFWLMALKYILFWSNFISKYGTQNVFKVNNEINFAEKIIDSIYKTSENREIFFKDFYNDYQEDNIRDYFFLTINKKNNNFNISSYLNIPNELIKINPKNMFQAKIHEINGINNDNINYKKNIIKVIYQFYNYAKKKAEVFNTLDKILK